MFFRNSPTLSRLAIFACVAVAAIAIGTGGAAAQEVTINQTDAQDETRYAQEIDPGTRLVDWRYDNDRQGFVLVVETDGRTVMTITEAVQFKEGAGSGRIYQKRIPNGTSELFVPVKPRSGEAAVTITTPGSLRQNSYSYVSTGQARIDRPPIDYERAQILVVLTAIAAAGGTFRIVRKRREDKELEVDKIL